MAELQYLHNRLSRSSAVNVADYLAYGNAECDRVARNTRRLLFIVRGATSLYVRVKASRKAVLFSARNSKASHLTVNRALYRTSMIRIKSSMRPRTAIYTLYYKSLFSRELP